MQSRNNGRSIRLFLGGRRGGDICNVIFLYVHLFGEGGGSCMKNVCVHYVKTSPILKYHLLPPPLSLPHREGGNTPPRTNFLPKLEMKNL